MKKSGLTFNTIPKDWQVVPIKTVAQYSVSNVDKHSLDDQEPVRLCNYTDVYKNERITLDMDLMKATATLEEISKFHLEVDDVVITKDSESWNDIAIPAYIVETSDDLVCGYHLAIIRPKKQELNGRFLFRCLQSRPVALQLELASTGVTRYGLPKGAIGSAIIPLPPVNIQKQIADYLDRETTQIDNLIAAKEQMLTLLEEKREALISHAVTRGLDPNDAFKRSGLDWLGDIPQHWQVCQLKRIWESNDYGISENIRGDGEIKVLRMTCIEDGIVDLSKGGEVESVDPYLLLRKGDLLFNRTNSLDQVAKVGIVQSEPEKPTTFASYLVRIRTNDLAYPEFLAAYLNSQDFLTFARKNAIAAIGQANLSPSRYGEIKIAIPPKSEQEKIVDIINKEREKNRELENALTDSIALLKERRSALITAAVTGQIGLMLKSS
jgi:type I restriction enzyme S subunit